MRGREREGEGGWERERVMKYNIPFPLQSGTLVPVQSQMTYSLRQKSASMTAEELSLKAGSST